MAHRREASCSDTPKVCLRSFNGQPSEGLDMRRGVFASFYFRLQYCLIGCVERVEPTDVRVKGPRVLRTSRSDPLFAEGAYPHLSYPTCEVSDALCFDIGRV